MEGGGGQITRNLGWNGQNLTGLIEIYVVSRAGVNVSGSKRAKIKIEEQPASRLEA